MAPGSMTLADLKGRGRGGRGRGGGGGRAGRGQPFGRVGGRGGGGRRGKRAREEDDVAGANRAFQGGGRCVARPTPRRPRSARSPRPQIRGANFRLTVPGTLPPRSSPLRQLVSPPAANPWTHASGRVQPPPSRREVDRDAVRESWREKQVDLEDVSALAAFEERRRREEEEKARAAAEEEARAAKAARIAARAAARAASKEGPPPGDVIDLISDDEGDDDDDVRGKGRATSSTGGKENREAPREPTRAELAAEAAKRRAAYNEHVARSATASAIGSRGGRLGGASGDAPGYDRRGGGGGGGNPLLDPPRYMPDPASASAEDLRLSTDEIAEVRDVGMSWYPCSACLDTGNGGCTLIARSLAVRMGLCDAFGNPTGGGFARFVEVRGVVEGASERVPMTTLVYRIKGKEMCVQVGITGAALGCDLLISRREIAEFERDGYTLTAR